MEVKKYENRKWLERQYIKMNKSIFMIAMEYDYSKSTIHRWLNKFNIKKIIKKKPIYQNKKWLKNQYINLKKNLDQIAKEILCSRTTIKNWLVKFNILIRSISEAKKGQLLGDKNPSKRPEVRKKISEALKGRKFTEEHKKKLSKSMMGRPGWNKGKKYPQITGEKHYRWKGEKTQTSNGYILVYKPDHPFHSKTKYVYEHRLIMEKKLGRYLEREEQVHHINEIKDDNRIENLYLCKSNSEHTKLHKQLEKIALELFRSEKFGKIKFDYDLGIYKTIFEQDG